MAKLTKKIKFSIPVTTKSIIDGIIAQTCIGDIEVDAVATLYSDSEPDIDYNSIKWNGCNIYPLLDNFKAADEMMQHIHEAAHTFVADTEYEDAFDTLMNKSKLFETIYDIFHA